MPGISSHELARVIQARIHAAVRAGTMPPNFTSAEQWVASRLAVLRQEGEEKAHCRVQWYTDGRSRRFGVMVRRADGTIESPPPHMGLAETLHLGTPSGENVSAQTAAEEKRKRKAEKLQRLADKGAIKRAT